MDLDLETILLLMGEDTVPDEEFAPGEVDDTLNQQLKDGKITEEQYLAELSRLADGDEEGLEA